MDARPLDAPQRDAVPSRPRRFGLMTLYVLRPTTLPGQLNVCAFVGQDLLKTAARPALKLQLVGGHGECNR